MLTDLSPARITSAAPEELVLIMFEGALTFIRQAKESLEAGDDAAAEMRVERVKAIVRELDASLNHDAGGEISVHLAAIYDYVLRRLDESGTDMQTLTEVGDDLGALAEAWEGIVQNRRAAATTA